MIVHLEFATAYASILGERHVQVNLEAEMASLDEIITAMLCQFPHWEVSLHQNNFYENGKLNAMFISDQNILNGESILTDGALIRIFIPICGG